MDAKKKKKGLLSVLKGPEQVSDFQVNRGKTEFSPAEISILQRIRGSRSLQRIVAGCEQNVEYFTRLGGPARALDISQYPRSERFVEFAIGPHLMGRQELSTLAILFGSMPYGTAERLDPPQFAYTLSKVENLEGRFPFGQMKRLLFSYIGAFPIDREHPTIAQYSSFKTLMNDPQRPVAVLTTGTRYSSGEYGQSHRGFEAVLEKLLSRTPEVTHVIVPVSACYDAIANRYYLTANDPFPLSGRDFAKDGRFGVKGSLTGSLEQITRSGMKVTYNHLAATYLIEAARAHGDDFAFDAAAAYDSIRQRISDARSRGINLDAATTDYGAMTSSLDSFVDFCMARGLIIRDGGSMVVRALPLRTTFADYEEGARQKASHPRFPWQRPQDYDSLTESGRNHATKGFRKEYPLQYMANMVSHLGI